MEGFAMKKMKVLVAVIAALVLMTAIGETAQASGTPLAFIVTMPNNKPIIAVFNFSAQYTPAQITAGTSLANSLIKQFASSLNANVTVVTAQQLGGVDADTLHNALLPYLNSMQMYLYVKATKVSHPEAGTNLRFDMKIFQAAMPGGLYIGAVEVNELLANGLLN